MLRVLRSRSVVATLALGGLLLAVALWPRAVEVDLGRVERGPLVVTIDDEGETRVRDRFVVSTPVAGRVLRIELEPGDRVEQGRTIVATMAPAEPGLLDSRTRAELEAAAAAARADLGRAEAARTQVATELGRIEVRLSRERELATGGLVSRDQVEALEAELRVRQDARRAAEYAVNRARQEVEVARARLLQTRGAVGRLIRIPAPVDGVVLKRQRESEAVVPAGAPLVELGDPGQLEIVTDLLSSDAVRIKDGDDVFIEQWGGDRPLSGRVRRVEPSGFMKVSALGVEEQRVNVIVDFADPREAWRALGDGYRVEVRIVVWREPAVVKVPVGSLLRRGDEWAVFAVESGRARLKTIRVGQRNGVEAQVLEGLTGGETVVLHPPDTLSDGSRVALRQA